VVTRRGLIVTLRIHCVSCYLQITMYFTLDIWRTGDHRCEYAICCSVEMLFFSARHTLAYTGHIWLYLAQKARLACLNIPLADKSLCVHYCCIICIKIGGKFNLLILEFWYNLWFCYVAQRVCHSTQCLRGNLPYFEKALLRLRYVDITESTSIRSWNDYEDNGNRIFKEYI
jgi:hypothetical protein